MQVNHSETGKNQREWHARCLEMLKLENQINSAPGYHFYRVTVVTG